MSGKFYWTKILGDPVPNYAKDGKEWTLEFEPDAEGVKLLKAHKLTDRLKDKYEDRGKFISLRQREFNAAGDPNKPIRVYDGENNPWNPEKLIGNGSTGDIKIDIRDYGVGKKKGMYPIAVRILNLVEYQSSEFGAMDKDVNDVPPAINSDLDDDMPF